LGEAEEAEVGQELPEHPLLGSLLQGGLQMDEVDKDCSDRGRCILALSPDLCCLHVRAAPGGAASRGSSRCVLVEDMLDVQLTPSMLSLKLREGELLLRRTCDAGECERLAKGLLELARPGQMLAPRLS